jgi:hypothetical protein
MNFMAVVRSTVVPFLPTVTVRLHNIGIYSTATRPAQHKGEPEATNPSFIPTTTSMACCFAYCHASAICRIWEIDSPCLR